MIFFIIFFSFSIALEFVSEPLSVAEEDLSETTPRERGKRRRKKVVSVRYETTTLTLFERRRELLEAVSY